MPSRGDASQTAAPCFVLGLAGGIGAGKSAVARLLEQRGWVILDADADAKAALDRPEVREALVSWWGRVVLDPAGRIDRAAVARIVFNDDTQRRRLEELIHPLVRRSRAQAIEEALEALGARFIVMRHPASGSCQFLLRHVTASLINAGDGSHEHPTQALLDALTIQEALGRVEGARVSIIGDALHSRVARSNALLLTKLGAEVRVVGPPTMIPLHISQLGVRVYHNLDEGLRGVHVIMMLRLQLERQGRALFPTIREYARQYGLTGDRVKLAEPGAIVMHPGPINRGVEIAPDVADSLSSVILDQVANGVAVRMGILYLMSGAG